MYYSLKIYLDLEQSRYPKTGTFTKPGFLFSPGFSETVPELELTLTQLVGHVLQFKNIFGPGTVPVSKNRDFDKNPGFYFLPGFLKLFQSWNWP